MLKNCFHLILLPWLALPLLGHAQQLPDAGSQIQQIPAAPVREKAQPQIRIEPGQAAAPAASSEQRVRVQRLQISGAKAFAPTELLAVTGFAPGSELTLADLRGMAARITQHYRSRGYFVAQALLPAQDILDGVVRIAVLEGVYGAVSLRNRSTLNEGLARHLLSGLDAGAAITADGLAGPLLLLSDLPGVAVKSTLLPGASVGASDLIVELDPGRRVTGSLDADNQGSRYTGQYRAGASLNLNNLAGLGDVASLRALTSGAGLRYGRFAYQLQMGAARLGFAYADMSYTLGREFESLQYTGSTQIRSLYGAYPLLRSRGHNLVAQLAFDDKQFQDRQDASGRGKTAQVWMLNLNGDTRDEWFGGGFNTYGLSATRGHLDAPVTVADSQGYYSKLGLSASRLQNLSARTSIYLALNAQLASRNLDSAEKMGLGGGTAVRAYPAGEAYGDQGLLLTLESRTQLPVSALGLPGQMLLIGFADGGRVRLNKRPWDAATNRRTLGAAGLGLHWAPSSDWALKAYYAHKLGHAPATSAPDAQQRLWLQAVTYF